MKTPRATQAALSAMLGSISFAAPVVRAQASQPVETFPELAPETTVPAAATPLLPELGERLAEAGAYFELDWPTFEEVETARQKAARQDAVVFPGPATVGFVRALPVAADILGDWSVADETPDGRQVWTLGVRSPGAAQLRLHLSDVDLGEAGSLLLYAPLDKGRSASRSYFGRGPDGDGDFWPETLPGDLVFIEVTSNAPPSLKVNEVVHIDPAIFGNTDPEFGARGGPQPCNLDVRCFSVNTAARQAVGRMRYIRDGEFKTCTGTLIADLDPETFVPYFLTANHCVDETVDLDTLEVFWFFQTPSCNGTPPSMGDLPSSVGGKLLATSGATVGNDASVLRLNGPLPPGIGFAGWSSNNDDEELGEFGIHHPAGSWKRVVFGHYVSLCTTGCGCFTPVNYAFYRVDDGIVEPGSSGSAMFKPNGQLIGQLFGSCSSCPNDFTCEQVNSFCLQYGEFAETYPDISYWMNLGGTLWVSQANLTPPWNGLQSDPYRTVGQANAAAWDGVQLKIVAGTYVETPTLSKQMTVRASGGLVRIGG